MTYNPAFPKPKKRREAKPADTFRKLYRELPCLLCESPDTAFAHWPTHRGSGGRVTWQYNEGVPLCKYEHDLADGRLGVSDVIEVRRAETQARIAELAPLFWERIAAEYGL
jgi:hypothetical protein